MGMRGTQEENIKLGTTEHGKSRWTLPPRETNHLQVSETSRRRKDSVGSEKVGAVPARLRAHPALRARGVRTPAPELGAEWGEGCGVEGVSVCAVLGDVIATQ